VYLSSDLYLWQVPSLTFERLARDKCPSLFGLFVNCSPGTIQSEEDVLNLKCVYSEFPEAIFLVMCDPSMNEM
jgi:hypothetical protein